jgi:hypothetical protein
MRIGAIVGGVSLMALAYNPAPGCAETCTVVRPDGSGSAFVIRPGQSDKFYELVRDKSFTEAATCCLACAVQTGTKVTLTGRSAALHSVRVLSGAFAGCVGELPRAQVGCQ